MFDFLTVNKFYRMSDGELELEAHKWQIREYGYNDGTISRQIIIDQLIKKDQANNSRFAFFISIIALIISITSIILKIN